MVTGFGSTQHNNGIRMRGIILAVRNLPRFYIPTMNQRRTLVLIAIITTVGLAAWIGTDHTDGISNINGQSPSAHSLGSNDGVPTKPANSSNVNVEYKSQSHTSSNPANNSSSTSLKINGQAVEANDGNVQKHIVSDDGSTTVDISIQNNGHTGRGM